MNTNKNISPTNDKGQSHGIWERYYRDGALMYKGKWINGLPHDYWEWDDIDIKRFYLR